MGLHYSSGIGKLYDKEAEKVITEVKYQLIETDPTKYTHKKWWGEFTTNQKIKKLSDFIIEFEDCRAGGCYVSVNADRGEVRRASLHYYRFYGRGKLGRRSSFDKTF